MLEKEFRIRPFAWLKRAWAMPVIFIAAFIICLWLIYRPWADDEIDWPSWVQAVGSIAAIGVAIWVSSSQARQARTDRLKSQADYMGKAYNTAVAAAISAETLAACVVCEPRNFYSISVYLNELRNSIEDIERFSYLNMADVGFADVFAIHRRGLRLLAAETERHLEEKETALLSGAIGIAAQTSEDVSRMVVCLHAWALSNGVLMQDVPEATV